MRLAWDERWHLMCALLECRGLECTGTLIGPKHVVTAAHCVFDINDSHQYVSALNFAAGQNGNLQPYGQTAWATLRVVDQFTQQVRCLWHYRGAVYRLTVLVAVKYLDGVVHSRVATACTVACSDWRACGRRPPGNRKQSKWTHWACYGPRSERCCCFASIVHLERVLVTSVRRCRRMSRLACQ